MYDPKFRLALLVCMILTVVTVVRVVYHLFFEAGLSLHDYFTGIAAVSGGAIGGFIFVLVCVKFITFEKYRKTGFEAAKMDETGTAFNFHVSLSKFLPEMVAPPEVTEDLHLLESELIGFLNGYRSWPFDISGNNNQTLYERAIEQWHAIKKVPQCTPYHRIAALAQDLSLVYAYQEKRHVYPYWMFWKRDDVKYVRRCEEHGGLSAFLLSTMPSFRKLHEDKETAERLRRAILTAVRYRDNPTSIPANCDPLAKEIYEGLHQAYQLSLQNNTQETSFTPTEQDVQTFRANVAAYFQSAIGELDISTLDINEERAGIYLGNGLLMVRMGALVRKYAAILNPKLRGQFRLWTLDLRPHVSWPYFLDAFRENLGVLQNDWQDVKSDKGLFQLSANNIAFDNAVFLQISATEYPELRQKLDSLPAWGGLLSVKEDSSTFLESIKRKAQLMDQIIRERNLNPPSHLKA